MRDQSRRSIFIISGSFVIKKHAKLYVIHSSVTNKSCRSVQYEMALTFVSDFCYRSGKKLFEIR